MKKPISFGKLDVHVVSSLEDRGERPTGETPFRILIMGDFTGRRGLKGSKGLGKSGRRPVLVDRDNLDEVMAELGPELHLPILGNESPPVTVRFSALDDFHPDELSDRLDIFQALKDVRRGIKSTSPSKSFMGGIAGRDGGERTTKGNAGSVVEHVSSQTAGSLLDEILEGSKGERPAPHSTPPPSSAWDRFLEDIVAPYLSPDIEPERQEMVAAAEAAMAELMRMIMHHAEFQALEANWRGLAFLTSRIETDENLQLYVLDLSKADLEADLTACEDLASTGLHRLLIEDVEDDGEPWGVVCGIYTFEDTVEDAELLGRVSKLAAQADVAFISGVSPRLLGCRSVSETPHPRDWKKQSNNEPDRVWEALRKLPETNYAGLSLPRFLLRLPYGAQTEPIERFDFEEMTESFDHEDYLWGNPAFACAYLLAQAFSDDGWDFQPGSVQDIEDLPLHIFKRQGESMSKPCAEVVLTHEAAEVMLEAGFMPLLSFRNQDVLRLGRFQSISNPPGPLRGRWKAADWDE